MRTENQKEAVLQHLSTGARLSAIVALHEYGCMRLAARVNELRKEGHVIETVMMTDGDKRWAEYKLNAGQPNAQPTALHHHTLS